MDPGIGLERRGSAAGHTNRLDREPAGFHQRVRARYLELARAEPARWILLDAALDPDPLELRIREAVEERLGRRAR